MIYVFITIADHDVDRACRIWLRPVHLSRKQPAVRPGRADDPDSDEHADGTDVFAFSRFDILGLVHMFTGKEGVNLLNSYWPSIITSATATGLKAGLFIYIFRQFSGAPEGD